MKFVCFHGISEINQSLVDAIKTHIDPLISEGKQPRLRKLTLSAEHHNHLGQLVANETPWADLPKALQELFTVMDVETNVAKLARAAEGEVRLGTLYGIGVYAQTHETPTQLRFPPWGYVLDVMHNF